MVTILHVIRWPVLTRGSANFICGKMENCSWFSPFICIGLITLVLTRAPPQFPVPGHGRIVIDAEGIAIPIAVPFDGIVLTWGAWDANGYLENTHAPGTMLDVGGTLERTHFSQGVMNWIYPEVEAEDGIWSRKLMPTGHGPIDDLEILLAKNAGAFLGNGGHFGLVPVLRELGLPALTLCWNDRTWDDCTFSAARVETALIGEPARGEAEIGRYKARFADLDHDLQIEAIGERPTVIVMGTFTDDRGYLYQKNSRDYPYFAPAAVSTPTDRYGRSRDAERTLMMDPDYIFLMGHGQKPGDFKQDPRWRGLKAVRDNRIYTMPGRDPGGGGLAGIIFQPLWTRWMAEIVHSDRLRPKMRDLLRATLLQDFDYRMNDDQIDELLRIKDNSGSAGYARFLRSPSNSYVGATQ
jgi:ABC-type Fe3+-hydroxamate transport system substrate-binding protein